MLRAPTCSTSAYFATSGTCSTAITSVTTASPVCSRASASSSGAGDRAVLAGRMIFQARDDRAPAAGHDVAAEAQIANELGHVLDLAGRRPRLHHDDHADRLRPTRAPAPDRVRGEKKASGR